MSGRRERDVGKKPEKKVAATPRAIFFAALVISVVGTWAVFARAGAPSPDVAVVARPAAASPREAEPPPPASRPQGAPLRVRIPSIGVAASLVPLGLNPDRTLQVPSFDEAGWYTGGSRPGEPGPAVIAAHVDSTSGPSVFYRLRDLAPGDLIEVDYSDATATFTVTRSASYPKSNFPTAQVYGHTDTPELRLVTCGGSFDRKAHSYRSNLVVWASLTGRH